MQTTFWNLNETKVQVGKQACAKVVAKWSFTQVYNIVIKSKEWLKMNYIIIIVGKVLPTFYIFKEEKLCDDYIKNWKSRTCMAMQKTMDGFIFIRVQTQ